MTSIIKTSVVSGLAAMLLAACGGGSSGGSQGNSTDLGVAAPPTVTDNGASRTINSACPVSQTIGSRRGDNLRIASVRWLQTVEMSSDDAESRLAGSKPVKVRIDLLASGSPLAPTRREFRVYDPATSTCTTLPVTGPARVPSMRDGETLNTAYVATIPANLVKPGMSVSLVFDDGSGRSSAEADNTYRVLVPAVAPAVKEVIRVIPLTLLGNAGYMNNAQLAEILTRLYPVSEVEIRVATPLDITTSLLSGLISGSGGLLVGTVGMMQNLLDTVDDVCASLNGSQRNARTAPKCLALIPDNLIFRLAGGTGQTTGLAFVGGITMLARSVPSVDVLNTTSPYDPTHWITYNAMTVAHEYGHLLDLDHASCGGATGIDPRLYSDGHLGGVAGYDATRNIYFSTTRLNVLGDLMFSDVMSYCGKEWMSDRGYLASMAYRNGSGSQTAARTLGTEDSAQWLKLSLSAQGWKIRRASFAPSTLEASKLQLDVASDQGSESLVLQSAVLSEHHETAGYGPFYVNLGSRAVSELRLLSEGVELSRWRAADL